ncbi:MAG: prepilin-type N-terminal cleavage/methylation domain-containing protein, partial [Desulfuromusa sp.]|nr:prepilin-type N-terminal cleavage/methylation domain-containing protein [Desulfuromusa sp.]
MDIKHVKIRWLGRRGFTLIELLIVCAIIGILAAIAIPVFNHYLEMAKRDAIVADIKNMETQILVFIAENGRVPDTLAEAGISLLDPWGNPFQYIPILDKPLTGPGKVKPRKDKFLHPLNSDYDLWSMGPDGQSQLPLTALASHDDIIRA